MALAVAGWVYVHAGQPETAVAHLQRATRLNRRNPRDFNHWVALAQALMQLGRDGEALDAARQAVQRDPDDVSSWRALAAVLALTGRLEEARVAMATLLRLAPNMSLTRMNSVPPGSGSRQAPLFRRPAPGGYAGIVRRQSELETATKTPWHCLPRSPGWSAAGNSANLVRSETRRTTLRISARLQWLRRSVLNSEVISFGEKGP
jgi:tetratricopeptide (TPR) repeat protein